MAITVEARTSIIELVVGMFGAAPGASVLSDLVAAYEKGQTIKQIAANLANTNEFKSIFPTFLTNAEFATKVVDQLVGTEVVAAEKAAAVTTLTAMLNAGASRSSVFVDAIDAVDAITSTNTAWANAGAALDNKVAVAVYYSVDKQLSGSSLAALQNVITGVTSAAASVTTAKSAVDGQSNVGQSFTLTTGVDNITGLVGNDTISGADASGATALVLGGLDVVDGGAGTDTLKIADAATATGGNFSFNGATIKNVENIEVTTNGSFDIAANTGLSLTGFTGLTSATLKAAGTDNSMVIASSTTDVNLTVAGAATAETSGGKAIAITAGTGTTKATGAAIASVSITGGGVATVTDTSTAVTSLKSVTFTGVAGATAAITGNAVADVTLKNQTSAFAATLTNATSTSLNVNVDGVGYTSVGGSTGVAVSVAAGAAATSITLNATGTKSNVAVSGAAATTLNITGSAALTLSSPITTATKIDGSAATGALTLGTLNAVTTTVSTGSGADSLTLSATGKATVSTDAGNDTVRLASAVAAGSSITLGAGDDKVLAAGGSVAASTVSAITVIDAGDGSDTVSASLINAANATQFKNFESLDLSATTVASPGLDLELMTGSTISSLTLSGDAGANHTSIVSNVAAGIGLSVSGDNTGAGASTTTINVKGATAGTTDAFTVTFAGAAASTAPGAATVKAGTVVLNEVETINIASSGGANTWNSIVVTDNKLKTLNITGDKNLDLTFAGVNGTNGGTGGAVKLIDGSAATGKLSINTTNVTADSATTGLTIKGGSAADTITLTVKATVEGGAGDDTITTAAAGGALTGGAGNDKFDVALSVATGATEATASLTTIADFAVGDSVKLLAGNVLAGPLGAKTALDGTVTSIDTALAIAALTDTVNEISWFQYGSNTYIVANDGTAGFAAGDLLVKLTGLIDLTNATLNATTDYLTLA